MPSFTQPHDTSTICDLVFKQWLDHYPPASIAALQDKYLSLDRSIKSYSEKLTKLSAAKSKLSDLCKPLLPVVAQIKQAYSLRQDFINSYGDLAPSASIFSFDKANELLANLNNDILNYAVAINNAYFDNLGSLSNTLSNLSHLRNAYHSLFSILTTIRDSYFNTEPNRRKPIIRDLYRLFSSLSDSLPFANLNPNSPNHTLLNSISDQELSSLLKASSEAKHVLKLLKQAR